MSLRTHGDAVEVTDVYGDRKVDVDLDVVLGGSLVDLRCGLRVGEVEVEVFLSITGGSHETSPRQSRT